MVDEYLTSQACAFCSAHTASPPMGAMVLPAAPGRRANLGDRLKQMWTARGDPPRQKVWAVKHCCYCSRRVSRRVRRNLRLHTHTHNLQAKNVHMAHGVEKQLADSITTHTH